MRFLLSLITIVLLTSTAAYAQQIYQIRADSVRIYNVCDTAELIIENRTQGVQGFLYNKGAGRTEFRRVRLEKIGNSRIAITGQDTLDLSTLPGIGGIDTIYRVGDNLIYSKRGQLNTVYAPLPGFVLVPNGSSYGPDNYESGKIVGFDAYDSPDMPMTSDQSTNPNKQPTVDYYTGHVVRNGSRGYQMAVNWDGEDQGVRGAFIRGKDDTHTTWGTWRELLFKDYADGRYALKSESDGNYIRNNANTEASQAASFSITGKGAIIKDYVFDNQAYHMGNLELRSAGNPAIGFHRHNVFGWALYSDNALSLRGRNQDGSDVGFWHSGNLIRPMGRHYYRLHPDDNTSADNFEQGTTFTYGAGAPYNGPLLSFGGLNGGYDCQINADYGEGNRISFRVRNGDRQIWLPWRRLIHEGNVATKGSNIVLQTDGSGYLVHENWIRVGARTGLYTVNSSYLYNNTPYSWALRGEPGTPNVWLEMQNAEGGNLGGFYADRDASIGIVNANANGWRLRTDAAGNAYVTGQVQATGFYQTSLRSLKKDIQPLPYDALPVLMKAQVRSFKFKADSTGKTNIGFIADEVPEQMSIPGRGGVDQASTVGLLVKSTQELNKEQTDLKQQVKDLQEQVKRLEAMVKTLLDAKK